MLRFSKLADYAVVVLARLPQEGGVQTSPCIAASTGIPEPTVAKVLKTLAAAGLVQSQRGARGGYWLARPFDQIAIADVVQAIDGPIALAACVDGADGQCGVRCQCSLHGRWDVVNDAVRKALGAISLSDLFQQPLQHAPVSPAALSISE